MSAAVAELKSIASAAPQWNNTTHRIIKTHLYGQFSIRFLQGCLISRFGTSKNLVIVLGIQILDHGIARLLLKLTLVRAWHIYEPATFVFSCLALRFVGVWSDG
jgi:hypothetical protein